MANVYIRSIRLSSQLPPHLRFAQDPHDRQLLPRHTLFHRRLHVRLPDHGPRRLSHLWRQDAGQRAQQLFVRQLHGQRCAAVLWPQHADDSASGGICLPRGHDYVLLPRRAV